MSVPLRIYAFLQHFGEQQLKSGDYRKEQLIGELIEVCPGVPVLQLNGTGYIESVQQLARLMKKGIAFLVDEVIDEQEVEPFVH